MLLSELVSRPELDLRVLHAGAGGLERAVRWVYTTDLSDPGRYLSGGELVISGLVWRHDPADSERFVAAVAGAGAIALAAGEAVFGEVPDDVVDACRRHDLTLLAVPVQVSFGAVTEAVIGALAAARGDRLAHTLGRQRQLLSAVAGGAGLDELAAQVSDATGLVCRVLTAGGCVVAGPPLPDAERDAVVRAFLTTERLPTTVGRHVLHPVGLGTLRVTGWFVAAETPEPPAAREPDSRGGTASGRSVSGGSSSGGSSSGGSSSGGSMSDGSRSGGSRSGGAGSSGTGSDGARSGGTRSVDWGSGGSRSGGTGSGGPRSGRTGSGGMGSSGPRSGLAGSGPVWDPEPGSAEDADTMAELAAIAALDRGRRRDTAAVARPIADDALARIAAGEGDRAETRIRLRQAGVEPDGGLTVVVLRVSDGPDPAGTAHQLLTDALTRSGPAAVGVHDGAAVALLGAAADDDRTAPVVAALGRLAPGLGSRSLSIGTGRPAGPEALSGAFGEALHAAGIAAARPGPVAVARAGEMLSHVALLAGIPDDLRRAFAAQMLGPIMDNDARTGGDLLDTLEAFLDESGSWNRTAARLHVHVNTVRYRIGRVEELTGRDLGEFPDRVDLYLALRAR